ncbi:MAG: hypothetical protein M1608_16025 [Candidatus Omnitrophica bacterium]|nr:hypothetical protein [Candidatus Omnitrophota bacterium]
MNADVPQRALQMSQILHEAGIEYMTLWRGFNEGYFHMASPDGSSVLAFDYENFYTRIWKNYARASCFWNVASNLAPELVEWGRAYAEKGYPPEFAIVDWFDYQSPHLHDDVIAARNRTVKRLANLSPAMEILFPPIQYSTFTMILDHVARSGVKLRTYTGSRQCPWYYDQGPGHHWAITARREAVALLTAAEEFSTLDALVSGNMRYYPADELSAAWQAQIYTDHGWGGDAKDQDPHDSYFQAKLEYARDTGEKLLDRALNSIAMKVRQTKKPGQLIVVFNPLSWKRTDPVTCTINQLNKGGSGFHIVGPDGREIPFQVCPVEENPGAPATAASVTFIATDVPPIGYKTYYAVFSNAPVSAPAADTELESLYYRVD